MTPIKWIKALSDNDETPVNKLFNLDEPIVTMIDPDGAEYPAVRRNGYLYRLMIEAGYVEKVVKS